MLHVSAEGAHPDAAWRRLPASISGSVRTAAEGALLAAILVAAGFLFHRGLGLAPSFDEAVYLDQTNALLHGQRLGTDVFAAQPPGFHGLLLAAAKIGGLTLDRMRLSILPIALLGLVAAFLVGRRIGGPAAGVIAAAVLAVAPPYPSYGTAVMADLPGCVLALLALACLLEARGNVPLLVLGGVLVAAAEWVKLDAFILVIPALAYVRPRALAIAGAAAAAATGVGLAVLGGSLPGVWRGAVSYHLGARGAPGAESNVHAVRSFFDVHQPFTWIVVVALLAFAFVRRSGATQWPLWGTALLAVAFLLWHKPLRDNHFVLLSVALAPAVGVALAPVIRRRPLAVVVLVALVAAGYVQETRRLDRNAAPIPSSLVWAAQQVDVHSTPGQLVVSDEPIVAYLAHRVMPGAVIDTANLRFYSGYLTDEQVIQAIARNRVPVVVVDRAFRSRPALLAALERRFGPPQARDGVRIYAR